MLAQAAALSGLMAGTAAAQTGEAFYPAAQCAAFWLGYVDYAEYSAYLDAQPRDLERAEAYRAVALRLAGSRGGEVDRFIAEQRPLMARMTEAYIYGGDPQSRDIFETLTETCEAFGRTQPEIQGLI